MSDASGKPGRDCPRCPRLVAFREDWRRREPDWFNAPVASFGPRRRAAADRRAGAGPAGREPHRPAVHRRLCRRSALRHARRATASPAASIAARPDDGLDARRCPHHQRGALRAAGEQADRRPRSRPAATSSEATIAEMPKLRAIVALGRIAHDSAVAALGQAPRPRAFGHGAAHEIGGCACSTAITARATTRTPAC